MTMEEFLIIFACCLATMVACRCIPIFVLKGRDLPESMRAALNFIPPAAFAALVANDLFKVGMFDAGLWPALLPFVASVLVVFVARKTKSLIWCIVCGVGAYALLLYL